MPGAQEAVLPRPLYFICREDGGYVPLIAADELPHGLQLRGVPRRFADVASTAGMMNLGVIPSSSRCYILEPRPMGRIPPKYETSDPHRSSDAAIPQSNGLVGMSNSNPTEIQSSAVANITQHFVDTISVPLNPAMMNGWRPSQQANGETAARKEKEYCTYWLFHGECAFIHSVKGCKFKHEMPQDAKTMAEVGLKGLPKWWLDRARTTHRCTTDWRMHGGNGLRRPDLVGTNNNNNPNVGVQASRSSTGRQLLKATSTTTTAENNNNNGSRDTELLSFFSPRPRSPPSVNKEQMNSSPTLVLHESTSSAGSGGGGGRSLHSSTINHPVGVGVGVSGVSETSPSSKTTNGGDSSFRTAPTSPADTRSSQGNQNHRSMPPMQILRRHDPYCGASSSDEDLVTFN
ncbi:MAG: hypothetical protein M1816_006938 [Peltula sp. TS41687]|nr:MAG: hypothetical protein M1816_006938 [Peltula sp. TS41687]